MPFVTIRYVGGILGDGAENREEGGRQFPGRTSHLRCGSLDPELVWVTFEPVPNTGGSSVTRALNRSGRRKNDG